MGYGRLPAVVTRRSLRVAVRRPYPSTTFGDGHIPQSLDGFPSATRKIYSV